MAIMQGDLAEYALPDLLMFLQGMRKQGQLIIENAAQKASAGVYFQSGEVVHAWCPPQEGEPAIHQLLRWREGRFAFLKNAIVPARTIRSDLQHILLEGMRRIDESRHIDAGLPSGDAILHVQRDMRRMEEVRLTVVEWKVLSLVNGRRSLDQVVAASGREEQDARRLVFGLIATGLILTSHDDSYLAAMVPRRVPAERAPRTRSSPPTMLANLLLREVDGRRSLREVKAALGCGEPELMEEFCLLERTAWVELERGRDVFERYYR